MLAASVSFHLPLLLAPLLLAPLLLAPQLLLLPRLPPLQLLLLL
jgi:hypothetical protein